MAISCSANQPARWRDIASIGKRVDTDYAPYDHTTFRQIKGKYVWLFDPYNQNPASAIDDHFFDTTFTLNEAEQAKYDEGSLVFVGRKTSGAQALDCFCCPIALFTNDAPIQLGDYGGSSSCFTSLDFTNPFDGSESSVLHSTLLEFYATYGNRTKRKRSAEIDVDGERLLPLRMRVCKNSSQRMVVYLRWLDIDEVDGTFVAGPGVDGTYALRRVEMDIEGQVAFQIKKDDFTRLIGKIEDKLNKRCSNSDTKWSRPNGIELRKGCRVSLENLIYDLKEDTTLSDNPGCLDAEEGDGIDADVSYPWEEPTCGGVACSDGNQKLYCETLTQLDKIVDEVLGSDLKDDIQADPKDCRDCCTQSISSDCHLTLVYVDANACEDDAFDVVVTTDKDVTVLTTLVDMVSSPPGCCGSSYPCPTPEDPNKTCEKEGGCPQTRIEKDFTVSPGQMDCEITVKATLSYKNCCNTRAVFSIEGETGDPVPGPEFGQGGLDNTYNVTSLCNPAP